MIVRNKLPYALATPAVFSYTPFGEIVYSSYSNSTKNARIFDHDAIITETRDEILQENEILIYLENADWNESVANSDNFIVNAYLLNYEGRWFRFFSMRHVQSWIQSYWKIKAKLEINYPDRRSRQFSGPQRILDSLMQLRYQIITNCFTGLDVGKIDVHYAFSGLEVKGTPNIRPWMVGISLSQFESRPMMGNVNQNGSDTRSSWSVTAELGITNDRDGSDIGMLIAKISQWLIEEWNTSYSFNNPPMRINNVRLVEGIQVPPGSGMQTRSSLLIDYEIEC